MYCWGIVVLMVVMVLLVFKIWFGLVWMVFVGGVLGVFGLV